MEENTQNPLPATGAPAASDNPIPPAPAPMTPEVAPPVPPVAEVIEEIPASVSPAPVAPATPAPAAADSATPAPVTPPPTSEDNEPETVKSDIPAFVWNERTKDIAMWSVVASIILAYFNQFGSYIAAKFMMAKLVAAAGKDAPAIPPVNFNFAGPIAGGIIDGLITAAILYFLYRRIFTWVQSKPFGKYLDNFFKLMFYPYMAVAVLMALVTLAVNFMGGIVLLVIAVGGHFLYAQILDKEIGRHFEAEKTVVPAAPATPSAPAAS